MYDISSQVSQINASMERAAKTARDQREFDQGFAHVFFKQIVQSIRSFEEGLDNEHETSARLVTFGQVFQFHIRNVGYSDPYLIIFIGELDDGSPVKLVQHVSQISYLLVKSKRKNPELPKRPIGFREE